MKIENDGRRRKHEQLSTYKDCFYRRDYLSKRTYLQGEPGSGKTSFAAKLVYDWCNVHAPSTECTKDQMAFGDVDILHTFKFLFFISLRDSRKQTYVTHMIKTQLIYKIYAEDQWESAYKLVLKIMKNVMYLVVQDGLDEWPGEHAVPSIDGIPIDHCIVLTTSRPWKLADERIKLKGKAILKNSMKNYYDAYLTNQRIWKKTFSSFRHFLRGVALSRYLLRLCCTRLSSVPG
ncbi:hypothetical protein DPMN_063705 [Dreissena polymorpha]|uniref:NACHT domain-containing protein n=1 Tax=Dreissena polymorpha TaxID=45954 RepID=A0A9D4HLE7_DREPO|nr:hypothetical protein DPMN_063705 [Dreissena polymorpha]